MHNRRRIVAENKVGIQAWRVSGGLLVRSVRRSILLVRGRILAMCFGHVHIPLNDDAFERQFGLKVGHNGLSIEGLVPAPRVTIEYPLVSDGTCANGIDYAGRTVCC